MIMIIYDTFQASFQYKNEKLKDENAFSVQYFVYISVECF